MRTIDFRIGRVLDSLDREFRPAVLDAVKHCDGTLLSFQEELSAQTWDHPTLPVDDIINRISYDII